MVTAGGFPACSYHKLTNFSTNQNFSIYFYPPHFQNVVICAIILLDIKQIR